MSPRRNPKDWIEKKARKKTGYPLATVAHYGPDDKFASKVVVGILVSEKDEDISAMKKWFSEGTDVRLNTDINEQIVAFMDQNKVQRVIMVDRIIGCPHEEGIDYPEGEKCPQCRFWLNRDRWTGELL